MSEKLPSGEACKRAGKEKDRKRSMSRRLAALQREWVGDSEMTREQLIQKQRDLREAMYERHPHLRLAS